MFRLARLLILVGLGFYLGYEYHEFRSIDICLDAGGRWADGLCQTTE